jgi:hypothetical protein
VLRRSYAKDVKRAYPMTWLCTALDSRYRRFARLRGLVISRLDPDAVETRARQVLLDRGATRDALAALLDRECFDEREPSFCPWHGLPLPRGAPSGRELVARMRSEDVRVWCLQAQAPGFESALQRVVEEATA